MSYLEKLNTAQREAVTQTEGPLLVLAGAGTGKTRVLTHRIAYIVDQKLAEPSNILAVTFTNKASREMQERVIQITNNCAGLNIGTFHSISAKMLRRYANYFDLSPYFSIASYDDQIKLVKELMISRNIDIKNTTPKTILNIISKWKDMGLLPAKVSRSDITSSIYQIAYDIYPDYQSRLVKSNAVDFGDLLLYNNELLINNADILSSYQNSFKYVMIDEYQDTNSVQYVWARMIAAAHGNICCVGDDDQSIYGWRGAEVGNILRFEKDFKNAKIIKLEQNYRSSKPILIAADSVIKNNMQRHSKTLWTNDPEGEKIKIISCRNDKEEAKYVISKIQNLIRNNNLTASDIAILVRIGAQTRPFEEALISSAIPYRIIGGLKFYERMEIKDVLSYIRVSINNDDDIALERIINVPKRGIGDSTIASLKSYAQENNISILRSVKEMIEKGLIKNKIAITLSSLVSSFESWNNLSSNYTPSDLVKRILEESGYFPNLKQEKTEESKARIDNINEMLRAISDFSDIRSFVEHASLVMENDNPTDNSGFVSLMTLHAAKGLEFNAVFLPGWEEGIFPHQRSINEDPVKGIEEERRIAYVGITRAKKFLWITHSESRFLFNEFVTSIPSRFLNEIPNEISEKATAWQRYDPVIFNHSNNFKKHNMVKDNNTMSGSYKDYKLSDGFSPGAKVSHISFGEGRIIRRNIDNLEIIFKDGIKTIKKNFVKLL